MLIYSNSSFYKIFSNYFRSFDIFKIIHFKISSRSTGFNNERYNKDFFFRDKVIITVQALIVVLGEHDNELQLNLTQLGLVIRKNFFTYKWGMEVMMLSHDVKKS